jgi:DNA-binding transcriptional regulator YiaG
MKEGNGRRQEHIACPPCVPAQAGKSEANVRGFAAFPLSPNQHQLGSFAEPNVPGAVTGRPFILPSSNHAMPLRFAGAPGEHHNPIPWELSHKHIFLLTTKNCQHIVCIVSKRYTGKDIRKLRKSLGWTQAKLAAELGVRQGTVSRFETGEREPSLPVSKLLTLLQWEAGVKSKVRERGEAA